MLMDVLKGNEFVSKQTFEEFLKRQSKGKKHLFSFNIGKKSEAAKKLQDTYLEMAEQRQLEKEKQKLKNVKEARDNNMKVSLEIEDLRNLQETLK